MQLVQESLLKGTQFTHQWGEKSVKRTRVDQAKTTRTEQTTKQQTKRSRTGQTQTTKQPTGRTTKQPTGQTTKQPTATSRCGGQTTKQPTATTRLTDQTPDEAAGAAATTKKPSKKVPSPWGSGSRGRKARATTDRVHHRLLRVGDLGAEVGAGAGIHQTNELGMKRLSLGAQQLKFLAKVAKQRRDRGRYLVGGRRDDPGRGAHDRSRGLGQRRANTC
jgi:hypothetical protein